METTTLLPRHPSMTELDQLCVNTIRCLAIDAIQKAKSGHPGMPMGMAPAAYELWTRHLKFNPRNPQWPNRDRFILSAGHGCMLLYSLLHLTGYDVTLDDIKNFRQWGSKTPGHPEYGLTPGVEVTSGPLGQGISNAVGMAIAEKYLEAYFNRDGFPVVNYRIYVVAGDGCLMEGVSSEASSLAGHLGLNNLIVIYDDNSITIDGKTSLSFSESVARRYEAYGWFVQSVDGDGNDLAAIDAAIQAAQHEKARPCLIKLRTHIGYGSPNKQDTAEVHGSPLGDEEVALTKRRYGWDPGVKFHIPPEAARAFQTAGEKGVAQESAWNELFKRYAAAYPDLSSQFRDALDKKMPPDWENLWKEHTPVFEPGTSLATREAQGKILDAIMPRLPLVIGGSADLTPSNNTRFKGATDFSRENRLGRYIRYGVREHGMGALMNGMALSAILTPYGGTFFVFLDYMRPSVRLAALSHYPVIFVYTHDSIGLGEDGPTHQAVEQLSTLRALPGMVAIRPADANETVYAWKLALEHRGGPIALVLTRQKLPVLDQQQYGSAQQVSRGGYVLSDAQDFRAVIIGSGSEVHVALTSQEMLAAEGIPVRVVSMPSWELFERQPREYRDLVLPPACHSRVAVEAGVKLGWERYIGDRGEFVGMSSFGASAPVDVVFKEFGITPYAVTAAVKRTLV